MQRLLRYNDFENDPLSLGNAGNAISSRYDLRTTNAKSYGGVDTKVTSFSRVMGGGKKVVSRFPCVCVCVCVCV